MGEEQKKKIALFRFGVIADLVGRKKLKRGEREAIIRDLARKEREMPFSGRSSVSRSTIREWLRRYERSGKKLESLFPKDREDEGGSRSIDEETELALVNLRRELKRASLPVLLRVARRRKILPPDFSASVQSVYRMFRRHGLHRERISPQDRRRFEVELPNDLWQADCMHGLPVPEILAGILPEILAGLKKGEKSERRLAVEQHRSPGSRHRRGWYVRGRSGRGPHVDVVEAASGPNPAERRPRPSRGSTHRRGVRAERKTDCW